MKVHSIYLFCLWDMHDMLAICTSFKHDEYTFKCGSKVNFIYNINRQDNPEEVIIRGYLNQQNTEHECHCTGAN